jgi:hypothetical protein
MKFTYNSNSFFLFRLVFIIIALLTFNLDAREYNTDLLTHRLSVPSNYGTMDVELHYNAKFTDYVRRVVQILEQDAPDLINYFQYVPQDPVHFVLKETRETNGIATVFPRNLITLYSFPPLGSEYLQVNDDWVQALVLHELTHVIHMDQTTGFLSGLRTVFGSFAKWGGVVPRWFSEGVAVWAESTFTDKGRMKNAHMEFELKNNLFRKKFCKTIDCLDYPAPYPGGRFPYWAGGYFLSHLEKSNAGTLRCLVKENSDSVPFFLNHTFRQCINEPATRSFIKFRGDFFSDYDQENKSLVSKIESIKFTRVPLSDKYPISLGKGIELIDHYFIWVQQKRRKQELVSYNLNTKQTKKYNLSSYIDFIGPSTNYFEKNKKLYVPMAEYNYENLRRKWGVVNLTSNESDVENLDYSFNTPDYLLPIDEKKSVSLIYNVDKWKIYLEQNNKRELVTELAPLRNISQPVVFEHLGQHYLFYKFFNPQSNSPYQLEIVDLKNKKRGKIYLSKSPIELVLKNHESFILKNNNEYFLYDYMGDQLGILNPKIFSLIVEMKCNQKHSVILFKDDVNNFYHYNGGCGEFYKEVGLIDNFKEREVSTSDFEYPLPQISKETFPSWRHYRPNYWLLNYQAVSENMSYWAAMTTLSDPENKNTFSLLGRFYSPIDKFGPEISYRHNFRRFYTGLSYDRYYTDSSIKKSGNEFDRKSVYLGAGNEFWRFYTKTELLYDVNEISDFLGDRKYQSYELQNYLQYITPLSTDLFNGFNFAFQVFYRDVEARDNYWGGQSKLALRFHPWDKLYINTIASYGKLKKTTYSSGTLYGGESSSWSASKPFHEFYGVLYSDIFGNEIRTGRAQFVYRLMDVYRGYGLFPFYLKQIDGVMGHDYVKSDFVYVDKQFIRKESLTSSHVGIRLKSTLFYYVPSDIDFLYVKMHNNRIVNDSKILLLIQGSLIP